MTARRTARRSQSGPERPAVSRPPALARGTSGRSRTALIAAAAAIAAVAVLAVGVIVLQGASSTAGETVVTARGGHWTNVSPDRLSAMLGTKDFTLVNVKTPYIGEIPGTDLYIPYDQLVARTAELPQAHDAKILVYCRSGAESAEAAQTLLDLGYTNVWNLDGGMNAWTASGRSLVNLGR